MAGTKTYVAKPGEVTDNWFLVDGSDKVVGRLASEIAMILMGKHRPTYTPHVLTGDSVIVVNCEKVVFTGKKWEQKTYAHYTGYTRQRVVPALRRLERNPERIISEAVRRMLPKNKLATQMLNRLRVYAGPNHPHVSQNPQPKELGVKK